jgi:predicted signal transduction protein with EAL and GGDEF domain
MLRNLLRRLGVLRVTLGSTLASSLFSILLTIVIELILDRQLSLHGVMIAIIVPAVIAPIFSFMVFSLLAQLDETERRLNILSTTDELTSAYNRRYFLDLANLELKRAWRYGSKFTIAMMDVDNLKNSCYAVSQYRNIHVACLGEMLYFSKLI